MDEHTPGPWIQFADSGVTVAILPAGRNGEICSFGVDEKTDLTEHAANARLIAAAPKLLAALLLVREIIVEGAVTGFNCHEGYWADRLFASQGLSAEAVKEATGSSATNRAPAR